MADFVPPAHNSLSPFADMRGHHVAVRTCDLEALKHWYVEKLDFRHHWWHVRTLAAGG